MNFVMKKSIPSYILHVIFRRASQLPNIIFYVSVKYGKLIKFEENMFIHNCLTNTCICVTKNAFQSSLDTFIFV